MFTPPYYNGTGCSLDEGWLPGVQGSGEQKMQILKYSKILFPSSQGSAIVWSKTLTPGTNISAGQLIMPGLKRQNLFRNCGFDGSVGPGLWGNDWFNAMQCCHFQVKCFENEILF